VIKRFEIRRYTMQVPKIITCHSSMTRHIIRALWGRPKVFIMEGDTRGTYDAVIIVHPEQGYPGLHPLVLALRLPDRARADGTEDPDHNRSNGKKREPDDCIDYVIEVLLDDRDAAEEVAGKHE